MRTILLSLADQRRDRTDSHGIIGFSLGLAAALPAALADDERLVVVASRGVADELDRRRHRSIDEVVVVPTPRTAAHRLWSDHVGAVRRERRAGADVAVYPKGFLPRLGGGTTRRVACLHDDIPLRQRADRRLPLRRRLRGAYFGAALRHAVRHADLRLYVSASTAARLARFERPGAVGVVTHEGLLLPAEGEPRAEDPRSAGRALLLGSPHPHKGTDRGIELVRGSVALRGATTGLCIVGWGTTDRGDLDVEHVPGPLPTEEILALLASCRLLVFPSTDEGFGLPPLEALALGVPVAYAGGGVADEVLAGVPGRFDPSDPASFERAAAEALALAPDDLAALGRAVRERFDWDVVADRVAGAIRPLLGQASPRSRSGGPGASGSGRQSRSR